MVLCLLPAEAAKKLLSFAAREMHTCSLAGYVITRQGCTVALILALNCLAWVEKFNFSLGLSLGFHFPPFFHKMFQNVQYLQHKIQLGHQK